eukprot:CAMPEP_0197310136 /NCGR_PEP_ID=MMETSP0891-20130614/8760_1 /TAXON_ID=44058 ORGANISM="Aureoumbra lagunensis, Strain CCMP1510" /NCGR_SAMPLE_ID=MMETSP0891 /ASSEMBLY_ACC=CAM_ASM_000534 /LENGTH=1110 /DNA_ID=CAMNT_0042795639 /DNA_START=226 /DNA_END=3558 /DNA_ORIENTATION=-
MLWSSLRLCAESVAGFSLLRARRIRGKPPSSFSVIAFHSVIIFEIGRVISTQEDNFRHIHSEKDESQDEFLVGKHLGYSDEVNIGFTAEFERSVVFNHHQLIAEANLFQFDSRARRSNCWYSKDEDIFHCLPGAYILGMPKSGSSELWERLVKSGALRAKRKETRFFTRGEFGRPRTGYLDNSTSLTDFARAHREASKSIETEIRVKGFSDGVVLDGGPHTLWWSAQAHDGTDSGAASVPAIFFQISPLRHSFFFVTLTEPGRRAYSDYWFLAEDGVVRPDSEVANAKSPHDFDSKMAHDCKALVLCFDKWNLNVEISNKDKLISGKWTMRAIQICAMDRFHFAQNGRGRVALGLYAAFLQRWLDVGFGLNQFAILRLEDNFSQLPSALERIGLAANFYTDMDEKHKANFARSARPPMLASTARRLRAFFAPHNRALTSMLNDDRFLWHDAHPNFWFNVTGRSSVENERTAPLQNKKKPRVDALAPGDSWRPSDQMINNENEYKERVEEFEHTKEGLLHYAATGMRAKLNNFQADTSELNAAVLMAAMRGDADTVAEILDAGANVNAIPTEERGITPLHAACLAMAWADSMRDSLIFRMLKGEPSPLDMTLNQSEAGRALIENRPTTSVGAVQVRAGLRESVMHTISILLSNGADVNAVDTQGRIPLHYCAQAGFPIDALIAAGANISAIESVHGFTPAHMAAIWGQRDIVQTLQKAGADCSSSLDFHGHSAIDLLFTPVLNFEDNTQENPEPPTAGGWTAKSVFNASLHGRCDLETVDADVNASELYFRFISRNMPVRIRGLASRSRWPLAFEAFSASELLAKHGDTEVTVSAIPYAKKFNSAAGARGSFLKSFIHELLGLDNDQFPLLRSSDNSSAQEESSELPWYVFRGHPVAQLTKEPDPDWLVPPERVPPPPAIYKAFAMASRFVNKEHTAKGEESTGQDNEDIPADPGDRFWPFVNIQFAVGGPGSGAPMHFHNTAWNALIYGTKFWIIYPPAFNVMSNQHIRYWEAKDRLQAELNPYAPQPKPFHCLQRQGDVLIVPELWGHGVINLHTSIAVATEVKQSQFRAPLPRAFRRIQSFHRSALPSAHRDKRKTADKKRRGNMRKY